MCTGGEKTAIASFVEVSGQLLAVLADDDHIFVSFAGCIHNTFGNSGSVSIDCMIAVFFLDVLNVKKC